MSYLSKIAARSALNNVPSLMPAMPFMAKGVADPFQQDINAQPRPDPMSAGNAPADRQNDPVKSVKHLIQEGAKHSMPGTQEKHFEKAYITKHIERIGPGEENIRQAQAKSITTNYIAPETGTTIRESLESGHSEKNANGNQEPVNVHIKPNAEPADKKTTSAEIERSLIEPSPAITPIPERKVRNVETPTITPKVAKLNPAMPSPTAPAVKGNKAMPKLVIGKISVEILPPVAPQPAKVITRIVPAASNSESSKTNKLSFGLGQL